MFISALASLALWATKLAPLDAARIVKDSVMCVRAVPEGRHHMAIVKEVLWGSPLRRGDTFTAEGEPAQPAGTPEGLPVTVVQDSIVFLKTAKTGGGDARWHVDVYRINVSQGTVGCLPYTVNAGSGTSQRKVLLLDGRLTFRKDVPRKHRDQMSVAEVKTELLRLRSAMGREKR